MVIFFLKHIENMRINTLVNIDSHLWAMCLPFPYHLKSFISPLLNKEGSRMGL